MTTPAEIARGLTRAQREAVLNTATEWKQLFGAGTGAYKGAGVRGIIDYDGWQSSAGWRHSVRLTPLGLKVRRVLEQEREDG